MIKYFLTERIILGKIDGEDILAQIHKINLHELLLSVKEDF